MHMLANRHHTLKMMIYTFICFFGFLIFVVYEYDLTQLNHGSLILVSPT